MIGKIQRLALREVWKHEALDFTRWLQDNLETLNEATDLNLLSADRERSAGDFSVDLVADDGSGGLIIIENQLEKSDHDHLGKIITYLTALEAKGAVWLVKEPRPEHIKAIAWLNESHSAVFYLVKVEAIKIGDSPAAPLLTLIAGPSKEAIEVGETKKDIAERHEFRRRFWSALLEVAKSKSTLHSGISPNITTRLAAASGIKGLTWIYGVRQHDAQVELYIDRDKETGQGNRDILNKLQAHKAEIEGTFGARLEWTFSDDERACHIWHNLKIAGWKDEAKWPQVHAAMVDAMVRLEKALRPYIKGL
jgi:hypothetical protein